MWPPSFNVSKVKNIPYTVIMNPTKTKPKVKQPHKLKKPKDYNEYSINLNMNKWKNKPKKF